MVHREALRFIIIRSVGNFLVLIALYGVIATFGPAIMYEVQYQMIALRGIHFRVEQQQKVSKQLVMSTKVSSSSATDTSETTTPKHENAPSFLDILAGSKEQVLIPIDPVFSILIPKLGANSKIYPNVDPDNPQEYLSVLQHGVAHAKGSVFPGVAGTTYLFAHSADNWWDVGRYNAVFYTLNNLSIGDEIDVFFENHRYTYTVSQKLISDPQDSSLLTSKHEGEQLLVLQTCWPPGTTFKRLYIVAKPKKIM